jgi:hypothetical protein
MHYKAVSARKISRTATKKRSSSLLDIVSREYPSGTKIHLGNLVEFEFVQELRKSGELLYVAALPTHKEQPQQGRVPGLSPEINVTLTQFRMYKLLRAVPTFTSPYKTTMKQNRNIIMKNRCIDIRLESIGDAQTWTGVEFGIVWECFIYTGSRDKNWQLVLTPFWQAVEKSMNVSKIFTLPHDPAYPVGYKPFLRRFGYAQDTDFSFWWSKKYTSSVS